VTVSYTHTGKNDIVVLWIVFPSPDSFENRFYVAGGYGYDLSSHSTLGLPYSAVAAISDAGYDAFSNSYDDVVLAGNVSLKYDNLHMFSYKALGEMTIVRKAITPGFYGMSADSKLYTYFEGCSDGGG